MAVAEDAVEAAVDSPNRVRPAREALEVADAVPRWAKVARGLEAAVHKPEQVNRAEAAEPVESALKEKPQ